MNELEDKISLDLPPTELKAVLGSPLQEGIPVASKEDIICAIRAVKDPELGIDIYSLGLIYEIDIKDNGDIFVLMTLTAPTCPIAGEMPLMVATAICSVVGTGVVTVQITFDPPWTIDRLSEELKLYLGM